MSFLKTSVPCSNDWSDPVGAHKPLRAREYRNILITNFHAVKLEFRSQILDCLVHVMYCIYFVYFFFSIFFFILVRGCMMNDTITELLSWEWTSGGYLVKPLAQPKAICPGLCLDAFWISPKIKTSQPPCTTCGNAWSLSEDEKVFPNAQKEPPVFQFVLIASGQVPGHQWKASITWSQPSRHRSHSITSCPCPPVLSPHRQILSLVCREEPSQNSCINETNVSIG